MKNRLTWIRGGLLALAMFAPVLFARAESPLKNVTMGTPAIKAINVLRFAPGGVLLIGDGPGSQLVAIETGDVTAKKWKTASTDKIDEKLAGKLGAPANGIDILNMAVNPASMTAYFAVRKHSDKKVLLMTIDGDGKIAEFPLENVKHVVIPLPKGASSAVNRVTDLAWMGDRVIIGAVCSEEFASKLYTIPAPLDPKSAAIGFSTETFHVAHNKWETRAPMTALMPYEEKGKKYVLGAFACTPVVRYPIDEVQSNAKVKGESVIELGSGNQPRIMFPYEKDGKTYVLMNTFRFHHKQKPFGYSPYWTVRMEIGLMNEADKINEKAVKRLDPKNPDAAKIKQIEDFNGVIHLDRLDKERALVVKEEEKGGLTLAVLMLP